MALWALSKSLLGKQKTRLWAGLFWKTVE